MPINLVGDIDQLLYRFTGAKPEILTQEIDTLVDNVETVKLITNYRSTQEIVAAQLRLIAHNYSDLGGPYSQKLVKHLETRDDAPVGQKLTFEMFDGPIEEASKLSEEIESLIDNGKYEPGDIFVASRTRAQLGYLESYFIRAKIPFINITGGSFWASKHVQDVIAYLKLGYDLSDNEAFTRVYDIGSVANQYTYTHKQGKFTKGDYSPKRWLGKQFLSACNGSYQNIYKALTTRNGWRWKFGVADLEYLLNTINYALSEKGISKAIEVIIDECYKEYIIATDELAEGENNKLDDLETVLDISKQFKDCESFFEYVQSCVEAAEKAKDGDWSEHVILSTIHRLKGLERKVIAGIGLSEGIDDYDMPCGLLPHTFSLQPPPQFGMLPAGGMGRLEDERCLAFVLISRGKELVMLSGVTSYQKMGGMWPSRFVTEALEL